MYTQSCTASASYTVPATLAPTRFWSEKCFWVRSFGFRVIRISGVGVGGQPLRSDTVDVFRLSVLGLIFGGATVEAVFELLARLDLVWVP